MRNPLEEEKEFKLLEKRRNRVGYALHENDWANGHDYDEHEGTLKRLAELLPLDDDVILRQDGDGWMCVKGDFVNLQESPSWWGDTMPLALAEYLDSL